MGRKARHRRSQTDRNCYRVCARYLWAQPDGDGLVLVHGLVSNPYNRARRIEHAWIEIPPGVLVECSDGTTTTDQWMCYDPTTLEKKAVLLPRDAYYGLGAVEVRAQFTRQQALVTRRCTIDTSVPGMAPVRRSRHLRTQRL